MPKKNKLYLYLEKNQGTLSSNYAVTKATRASDQSQVFYVDFLKAQKQRKPLPERHFFKDFELDNVHVSIEEKYEHSASWDDPKYCPYHTSIILKKRLKNEAEEAFVSILTIHLYKGLNGNLMCVRIKEEIQKKNDPSSSVIKSIPCDNSLLNQILAFEEPYSNLLLDLLKAKHEEYAQLRQQYMRCESSTHSGWNAFNLDPSEANYTQLKRKLTILKNISIAIRFYEDQEIEKAYRFIADSIDKIEQIYHERKEEEKAISVVKTLISEPIAEEKSPVLMTSPENTKKIISLRSEKEQELINSITQLMCVIQNTYKEFLPKAIAIDNVKMISESPQNNVQFKKKIQLVKHDLKLFFQIARETIIYEKAYKLTQMLSNIEAAKEHLLVLLFTFNKPSNTAFYEENYTLLNTLSIEAQILLSDYFSKGIRQGNLSIVKIIYPYICHKKEIAQHFSEFIDLLMECDNAELADKLAQIGDYFYEQSEHYCSLVFAKNIIQHQHGALYQCPLFHLFKKNRLAAFTLFLRQGIRPDQSQFSVGRIQFNALQTTIFNFSLNSNVTFIRVLLQYGASINHSALTVDPTQYVLTSYINRKGERIFSQDNPFNYILLPSDFCDDWMFAIKIAKYFTHRIMASQIASELPEPENDFALSSTCPDLTHFDLLFIELSKHICLERKIAGLVALLHQNPAIKVDMAIRSKLFEPTWIENGLDNLVREQQKKLPEPRSACFSIVFFELLPSGPMKCMCALFSEIQKELSSLTTDEQRQIILKLIKEAGQLKHADDASERLIVAQALNAVIKPRLLEDNRRLIEILCLRGKLSPSQSMIAKPKEPLLFFKAWIIFKEFFPANSETNNALKNFILESASLEEENSIRSQLGSQKARFERDALAFEREIETYTEHKTSTLEKRQHKKP